MSTRPFQAGRPFNADSTFRQGTASNAEAALEPFTRTREQQALVRRAFQWTVLAHQGMQAGFDAFL